MAGSEELRRNQTPTILDRPEVIFLIGVWGISLLFLSVDLAEGLAMWQKVLWLIPGALLMGLVALRDPQGGFSIFTLGSTALVMGTGYQMNVGLVRTSALELLILASMVLMLWHRRRSSRADSIKAHLPAEPLLIGFIVYAVVMFGVSLLRGLGFARALTQAKGFVLYPLLAYVIATGALSSRFLALNVGVAVVLALFLAGTGLGQFTIHADDMLIGVYRATGEYAPENLFGLTLCSLALLSVGIVLGRKRGPANGLLLLSAGALVAGSLTSVSRTVIVALLAGALYLFMTTKANRLYLLLFGATVVVLLWVFPEAVFERLFQVEDSSSIKRLAHLEAGLRAFTLHPIMGSGWGQGYYLDPGNILRRSQSIPWFHNDYLNLLVQTGLVGLGLYMAFWARTHWQIWQWVRKRRQADAISGYAVGGQAALISLLIGALFEHVLWRPDIAGLVGWTLGLTVAAMRLGEGGTVGDATA